jgi:hypothetical protein
MKMSNLQKKSVKNKERLFFWFAIKKKRLHRQMTNAFKMASGVSVSSCSGRTEAEVKSECRPGQPSTSGYKSAKAIRVSWTKNKEDEKVKDDPG